jgi:hypothetical protein
VNYRQPQGRRVKRWLFFQWESLLQGQKHVRSPQQLPLHLDGVFEVGICLKKYRSTKCRYSGSVLCRLDINGVVKAELYRQLPK